jgi:hypothetical protein
MRNFKIGQEVRTTGGIITNGGLIGEITHTTKSQMTIKITDMFFPVHQKSWGKSQVDEDGQKWQKEHMIGQTKKFWLTGTRQFMEVGSADQLTQRKLLV